MNKILSLLICCLLLLPSYAVGESRNPDVGLIEASNSGLLFGDQTSLYILDSSGNIQQYLPERINTGISADAKNAYPFIMQGEVFVFNRDGETITRLITPDDVSISMPITQELAGGGNEWQLSSIRANTESVYFLFIDVASETPSLCRYQIDQERFDKLEIDRLREYLLTAVGETMAIAGTAEETIVYSVDWKSGKRSELYRLTGHYAGFAADEARLYAADVTGLSFVALRDGKEQARVRSPYAADLVGGIVSGGYYYALGSAGLYRPDFSAQQEKPDAVLRILEGYADEIDMAFMQAHPDVRLEYIPSTFYEGIDFGQALITGLIQYDIARLSNKTPAAKNLMDKGYTMDLSENPEMLSAARAMYKPIRDLIFQNGQLMLMPYYIAFQNMAEYNAENLSQAGLSPEDLPKTLEESLDFIIEWADEHGEPESSDDIVPVVDDVGNTKMVFLTQVMQTYAAHYRKTGRELNFDTQEFRTLIRKAMQAAEVTPVSTESTNYKRLWSNFGSIVPNTHSTVFPLSEDESPRYTGFIVGYIIDPRCQHRDVAMAYILWRINMMSELNKILLFEGQYSALEREDYRDYLNNKMKGKAALEASISNEESEVIKRALQEKLDKLIFEIENPSDFKKYQITDEEISFYQVEIIPNIEFPFADTTTEYSYDNVDTWRMLRRYADGEMDEERFVIELNQRERLRRLENK